METIDKLMTILSLMDEMEEDLLLYLGVDETISYCKWDELTKRNLKKWIEILKVTMGWKVYIKEENGKPIYGITSLVDPVKGIFYGTQIECIDFLKKINK